MKINATLCLLGIIPMLLSCASSPVTLAPVGPNPFAGRSSFTETGYLRVYSRLSLQNDDQNQGSSGGDPSWYQHTDYNLYDANGKLLKHVGNTVGHYSTPPRLVSLRPGTYIVRAEAKEWLSVRVPVVIEPGRTTKVHLDEKWKPPAGTLKAQVVSTPGGYAAGWSADLPIKGPTG